ncbi:MAG: hypothetical protein RLZZ292_3118 [Bacteroidota bacterium]|jgi:hypothetical protein
MKNYSFLFALFLLPFLANAQEIPTDKFHFSLGTGYSKYNLRFMTKNPSLPNVVFQLNYWDKGLPLSLKMDYAVLPFIRTGFNINYYHTTASSYVKVLEEDLKTPITIATRSVSLGELNVYWHTNVVFKRKNYSFYAGTGIGKPIKDFWALEESYISFKPRNSSVCGDFSLPSPTPSFVQLFLQDMNYELYAGVTVFPLKKYPRFGLFAEGGRMLNQAQIGVTLRN